jgi:DNA replication protein DnaC
LRRRQQPGKLDVLILDELGDVPAGNAGAELLFDVIATASESQGVIVTSNTLLRTGPRCQAASE